MKSNNLKPRFKVGDRIAIPFGGGTVLGRVTEDRGPIGHKGRRLFQITIDWEDREPDVFEMPEVDMVPAPLPKNAAKNS